MLRTTKKANNPNPIFLHSYSYYPDYGTSIVHIAMKDPHINPPNLP